MTFPTIVRNDCSSPALSLLDSFHCARFLPYRAMKHVLIARGMTEDVRVITSFAHLIPFCQSNLICLHRRIRVAISFPPKPMDNLPPRGTSYPRWHGIGVRPGVTSFFNSVPWSERVRASLGHSRGKLWQCVLAASKDIVPTNPPQ